MPYAKYEKIGRVSDLVIREMLNDPPVEFNILKIARAAKVSRPWIYKYFGSGREQIILNAIDCIAPQFTDIGRKSSAPATPKDWARDYLKNMDKALIDVEKYPHYFQFYLQCKLLGGKFGERIAHHESLFIDQRGAPRIRESLMLSKSDAKSFAELLLCIRLGLILTWLQEKEKTKANRSKLIHSVRRLILDRLKE